MKREELKEYFVNLFSANKDKILIREQEENIFDTPDDKGEEDKEEGGEGENPEGEEVDPKDDEKDDEEVEVERELSPSDYVKFGSGISQELTSVFDDFAAGAMKSDIAKNEYLEDPDEEILPESLKVILEQNESDHFNMPYFAGEVARLIKNYSTLLDMEALLFGQAKEYLTKRYGDEALLDEFEQYMTDVHKINLEDNPKEDQIVAPMAAGAGGEGGGS